MYVNLYNTTWIWTHLLHLFVHDITCGNIELMAAVLSEDVFITKL